MTAAIDVTAAAEAFLRRMLRFSGLPAGAGMRLVVSAGGCSGYNSEFAAEDKPRNGDAVLEVNGLKLFLPEQSLALLAGVTVDFLDTPMQTGLTFINPAGNVCACGSSGTGASGALPPGVARVDVGSIRRAPQKA